MGEYKGKRWRTVALEPDPNFLALEPDPNFRHTNFEPDPNFRLETFFPARMKLRS